MIIGVYEGTSASALVDLTKVTSISRYGTTICFGTVSGMLRVEFPHEIKDSIRSAYIRASANLSDSADQMEEKLYEADRHAERKCFEIVTARFDDIFEAYRRVKGSLSLGAKT